MKVFFDFRQLLPFTVALASLLCITVGGRKDTEIQAVVQATETALEIMKLKLTTVITQSNLMNKADS